MSRHVLYPYCTNDHQRKVLDAVQQHGGKAKAASALGCSRDTIHGVMTRLKKQASLKGVSPANS